MNYKKEFCRLVDDVIQATMVDSEVSGSDEPTFFRSFKFGFHIVMITAGFYVASEKQCGAYRVLRYESKIDVCIHSCGDNIFKVMDAPKRQKSLDLAVDFVNKLDFSGIKLSYEEKTCSLPFLKRHAYNYIIDKLRHDILENPNADEYRYQYPSDMISYCLDINRGSNRFDCVGFVASVSDGCIIFKKAI